MSELDHVIAAFNLDQHDGRVALLRQCLEPDAEVVHIGGVSTGPEAFAHDIGDIRERLPGSRARLTGEPTQLHGWSRQAWELHTSDGTLFATGCYVARQAPSGLLSHLLSLPDAHE